METAECAWSELFDEVERNHLEEGFFLTGAVSIILGLWLNLSILLTNLSLDRSYRNLANFTTAACARRIVPLLAQFPLVKLLEGSNEIDPRSCKFFAFLETFLAVYEVEWLTHVCIERYVVAKYTINGWPIQKHHYTLFQCLCLLFASLYSFPPLLGVGRYGFDFSCSFCTFDVILPESWNMYLVVMIFALRSVKPALFMLLMLIWARMLEKKLICSEETQKQANFTKNIITVTLLNQICWFPIALIRGGVVLSQLVYSHQTVPASTFYIKWAMWIHWVAPAVTVLTLFVSDDQIRNKMLNIRSSRDVKHLEHKKDI